MWVLLAPQRSLVPWRGGSSWFQRDGIQSGESGDRRGEEGGWKCHAGERDRAEPERGEPPASEGLVEGCCGSCNGLSLSGQSLRGTGLSSFVLAVARDGDLEVRRG